MSTDDVAKRRKEMDDEFAQFREHLGKILEAVERVNQAGPEDDISGLLDNLEDVVHKVRTGGVLGSGAKGHREAREKWLTAKGG
jgi:Asp-tRNA(Asn)/Glu-tRNA(Gln) amidotransferase C subunit